MYPCSIKVRFDKSNEKGHFDTYIQCIFQIGADKREAVVEHSLENQTAKYFITLAHEDSGNRSPLGVTVTAMTKSNDLSQQIIQFEETKFISFGTESRLEITLGNNYLYATGWTTKSLPNYPEQILETIPKNIAYNTTVTTMNLIPISLLNLESKPIIKKFGLKLTSGHFSESRVIGVSSLIPKQIDLDTYIFNLSNRLLGLDFVVEPKVMPNSKLHFNIKPDSPLEFKFSCFKNVGFTHFFQ